MAHCGGPIAREWRRQGFFLYIDNIPTWLINTFSSLSYTAHKNKPITTQATQISPYTTQTIPRQPNSYLSNTTYPNPTTLYLTQSIPVQLLSTQHNLSQPINSLPSTTYPNPTHLYPALRIPRLPNSYLPNTTFPYPTQPNPTQRNNFPITTSTQPNKPSHQTITITTITTIFNQNHQHPHPSSLPPIPSAPNPPNPHIRLTSRGPENADNNNGYFINHTRHQTPS